MADSWARTLGSCSDGITAEIIRSGFDHPQVAFDGGPVNQATHDVDRAIFGCVRVGGGTIARKWMVRCDGEIQVSLRPRIRRRVLVGTHTGLLEVHVRAVGQ